MAQLLGGHIPVISTGASEALEQVKAGKARIIAISAPQNLGGDFKDVPTWKSLNIDVSILHWRGLFTPPEVPQTVVKYWDDKLGKLMQSDAWKKHLRNTDGMKLMQIPKHSRKNCKRKRKLMKNYLKPWGSESR